MRTTFVQLTLLFLHHWTILRIYDATIRRMLVLFYTTVRFYGSLCFYTTVRFYTFTMLLYADCQFCFTPLYVSTTHFAFTPLYDSTHLRCYCTPTVSFVLHHCTILRICDAAVRRLSVLFYTTGRFYTFTMLLYADCQFCFTPLYDSTHLRCCCTPTVRNPG